MIGLEIEDISLKKQISNMLKENKYFFCSGYYNTFDLVIVQGKNPVFMNKIIKEDVKVILIADSDKDEYLDYAYYALVMPISLDVLISLIKAMDIFEENYTGETVKILLDLGVSPSKKGYQYLKDAVNFYINHKDLCIKDIYMYVAMMRNTKKENVERNIRYAIESAFDKCRLESQEKIFFNSIDPYKGKPTNMELICRITDLIELNN